MTVQIEKDLPFSVSEYRERLEKVRQLMSSRSLDCLILFEPENIFYLSGYQTTGFFAFQCIIIHKDKDPTLIIRGIEQNNAKVTSWVQDVVPWVDLQDPIQVTVQALKDRGLGSKNIGVETDSWNISVREFRRLEESVSPAKLVDGTGIVEQFRVVKSPREIEYMRKAAEIVQKAMVAGIDAVAEGVTENDLAAVVHYAMYKAGGVYPAYPPQITVGYKTGISHNWWDGARITKNSPVFLELGACAKRYHATFMRCGYVGNPPDELRKIAAAGEKAVEAGIAAAHPGATSADVYTAISSVFAKAGLGQYVQSRAARTGYSLGIAFPHGWDEGHILSLKEGDQSVLKAGMAFHMFGTIRVPLKYSGGCSETILITENGCEALTKFDRRLFIK